jgi:hypothetical protein
MMIDTEGNEHFIINKTYLNSRLEDIGSTPVSKEIELQLRFVEERLLAGIKQQYRHAIESVTALNSILRQSEIEDHSDC